MLKIQTLMKYQEQMKNKQITLEELIEIFELEEETKVKEWYETTSP